MKTYLPPQCESVNIGATTSFADMIIGGSPEVEEQGTRKKTSNLWNEDTWTNSDAKNQ